MVTVKGGMIAVGTHMPLKPEVEKKCKEKLQELSKKYEEEVLRELGQASDGVKFFVQYPASTI